MSIDKRGYRPGVRVIVTKGDLIAIGTRYEEDGKTVAYHLFPGGGVEVGETLAQATIKEVKEEVGMLVKDPQEIGYVVKYEKEFPQPDRRKMYRGAEDTWMTAVYVRNDSSLHGKEGDAFKYQWLTPDEAIALFMQDEHSESSQNKIQAILAFKEFTSGKGKQMNFKPGLEAFTGSLPTW